MKVKYPAMYALMADELRHRDTLRSRETFLKTDGYLEHILQEIYGDRHEMLLPKLVRVDIPFPGMRPRKFPGEKTYRIQRSEFINGLDKQDVDAVFRGIVTYKKTPYKVTENTAKMEKDVKGELWAPYLDNQRADHESIILQAERDWFVQGVTTHRIQNRVELMKLFWDHWDMELIYSEAKKRGRAPAYEPLEHAEMQVIAATIRKHRDKGDHYRAIIDKCMSDWTHSFKRERSSGAVVSDALVNEMIDELYLRVFEREPSEVELAENRQLLKLLMGNLERQRAIGKLIESLI